MSLERLTRRCESRDRAGIAVALIIVLSTALVPPAVHGRFAPAVLKLATTTSTADSGLLAAILPDFEQQCGCRVDVIAVGTGQALQLGRRGDVDVVLAHARPQEDQFVAEGHGTRRDQVMFNDFVIVGPAADPAAVRTASRAQAAFEAIARARAPFASRGDQSGTHTKELQLWAASGVKTSPDAPWYSSLGQGMGETLLFANERGAYTLSDRATWLAMQKRLPSLRLLLGGDTIEQNPDRTLRNDYGVIAVSPAMRPPGQGELAARFVAWLLSKPTQQRVGAFGRDKYGQSLFVPDSDEYKATRELMVTVGGRSRTFSLADLQRFPKFTLADHEAIGTKRGALGRKTWTGASLKDVLLAVDPSIANAAGGWKRIELASSDQWTAIIKWDELFGRLSRGEALWAGKGCNECHGTDAEGTHTPGHPPAPALRGHAFDVTPTLAMIHGGMGAHAGINAYTPTRLSRDELSAILGWLAEPTRAASLPPSASTGHKKPTILCYELDGKPLAAADGLIQLVVGTDEFASRYSHWVARIRVE
jgi:tungstate transport system substrate-binding protein